jgi:ubiquitin-like modifier-activating enzyme ATG7
MLQAVYTQLSTQSEKAPYFLVLPAEKCKVVNVQDYAQYKDQEVILGFIDPSTSEQNPGWPLRNLLTYMNVVHSVSNIRVLCWRDASPPREGSTWQSRIGAFTIDSTASTTKATKRPSAVGWEKNVNGKLGPRVADLAPMMDPTRLANQAVSLNLKLMRWRILPDLDLEKIASTKCLLLGAGTLGCYVARCLMAWGVQKITLVDSSKVSFSNPVRQPLFQFTDCLNGGKPKAETAAERLREIWPGLDATGHTLSIPMPGHPIPAASVASVQADVEKLEALIEEHDVVYLLMDSRESRWLPGVLGRLKGKLVMNAALGFDTFLVMRHGARPKEGAKVELGPTGVNTRNLGCYYCNDVVAPADVRLSLSLFVHWLIFIAVING